VSAKVKLNPKVASATLECARADIESEIDRARSLDSKLTGIASLSALALSISAAVGASVVVSGSLGQGFTIALGADLSIAALLLLGAALIALSGLAPKKFQGLSLKAAEERVSDERLSGETGEALAKLAATYYRNMLPEARETNGTKVKRVRLAYWFVGFGLAGLVLGLILATVAAVT
jgi:hypothetical protein